MNDRESLFSNQDSEAIREATPPELLAYAPAIYAMLSAVGFHLGGSHSFAIEESLRDRFETLATSPGSETASSGRLRLSEEWDGDEFVGLTLYIDVATIYADALPPAFRAEVESQEAPNV